MKKIMFSDKYLLTQAVLNGSKTMTRRVLRDNVPLGNWKETQKHLPYKVGEIVAIVQSYKEVYPNADFEMVGDGFMTESAGWTNKMFVRADLMPHHIKITGLREGVKRASIGFYAEGVKVKDCEKEAHRETASGCLKLFPFPRQAFASLIDKISGKGTWESNPFVVAYSFELID